MLLLLGHPYRFHVTIYNINSTITRKLPSSIDDIKLAKKQLQLKIKIENSSVRLRGAGVNHSETPGTEREEYVMGVERVFAIRRVVVEECLCCSKLAHFESAKKKLNLQKS